MAVLVVGLNGGASHGDESRSIDLGPAGTVDLVPQGLQSDGIAWYSADVADDTADAVVDALLARPDVESAYQQPASSPPG